MAEEKKPNLKDRLKKTQVGAQNPAAPAGPPGAAAPVAPPGGGDFVAPPVGAPVHAPSIPAPALPGIPGIPGLSGDVAPPPFVQEQQAAAKAAAKAAAHARAVADDPFGASTHVAGPQEVRIVVDERPVDDKEVGKGRAGTFIAVGATALVSIGIGYMIGGQTEVNSQNRQTLSALGGVREKAQAAGNSLATAKTKIEHACERANITGGNEDQQPGAAPSHPPELDMDLVTWFRESGGENAPFGPDVFAARMGRLDPSVSQKIAAVHVMFAQLWRELQAHSAATGDGASVRESLTAARDSSAMTLRLGMIFKQPQENAPWVGVLAMAQNVDPRTGQVTLAPLTGIPEPTRARAIFTGAQPLAPSAIGNTYVSINVTDGLGPQLQRASSLPWLQYRQRLTSLKNLVTQLANAQEGLVNKLSGRGG
jgi:hypothetical protein